MKRKIKLISKKATSLLIIVAILATMIPMMVMPALADDYPLDPKTPEEWYTNYTVRMNAVKLTLEATAGDYDPISIGGYTLDVEAEMLAYAEKIGVDLGVAAALAERSYNDPRFGGVPKGTGGTNNQQNFNAFLNSFGSDPYNAAVKYLEQGGIAARLRGLLSLTWFYWFGSAMNPDYSASESILGLAENGKITSKNLAEEAESFAISFISAADRLTDAVGTLKDFADEADIDNLKEYLSEQPCVDDGCEDDDCDDWTHRLLVDEEDWKNAVNAFKASIAHDINVVGALATGNVSDASLWFGRELNGPAYYNGTYARTAISKLEAACSFLEEGGFNCGSINNFLAVQTLANKLSYKSAFTNYNVEFSEFLATGFDITGDGVEVVPVAGFALEMLKMGATAGNLDLIYGIKVAEVQDYIKRATDLIGTTVPADGKLDQDAFDAAIAAFIAKAQRDLYVAAFLLSGDIEKDYASIWVDFYGIGNLNNTYAGMSETEKYTNAINFFNGGGYGYGYSLLGFGYQLEYKADFHPEYSSGLFNIAANKTNILTVMRDTITDLENGDPYLSPLERVKIAYDEAKANLLAIKDDPSAIIEDILSGEAELGQLMDDLNRLVGSLDDIVNIIDLITGLGLGSDILDTILAPLGLSSDMLNQLAGLRDILNNLGIDTSGDIAIEEALIPYITPLLAGAIDITVGIADALTGFGTANTVSAYENAIGTVNGVYDLLYTSGIEAINAALGPVMAIIEPLRPYLDLLGSGISLVNHTLQLVDQVGKLLTEFNVGNLSLTTYTLSYTIDDLADLLEAFGAIELRDLLGGLLGNFDIGGAISSGIANGLNLLINGAIGSDLLNLSGDDLGFIGNLATTLLQGGLDNPTALVPLLRAAAKILRNAAGLGQGLQDLFDGNFSDALAALLSEFTGDNSIIRNTADLWNALIGLFAGGDTLVSPVSAEMFEAAVESDPVAMAVLNKEFGGSMNCDPLTATMIHGILVEMTAAAKTLCDPKCAIGVKQAKLAEFSKFLSGIKDCVSELRETIDCVKSIAKWAEENLTKDAVKAFADKLARCYAERILECIKDCISCSKLPGACDKLKDLCSEIKDAIRFLKFANMPEELKITATDITNEREEGVIEHYLLTTNYDALREKLDHLLKALGISTAYVILDPVDSYFSIDGNKLISTDLPPAEGPESDFYDVLIAYQLFFDVCDHSFSKTLATTTVRIEVKPLPVGLSFDVIFDPNGGEFEDGSTGLYGEVVLAGGSIILPSVTRDGFIFDGWYDGEERVGDIGDEYWPAGSVTLMAHWTEPGREPLIPRRRAPVEVIPDAAVALTDLHTAYIFGYEDGSVRPEGPITRAEVSMILWRLLPVTLKDGGSDVAFSDVPDRAWYAEAVNCLAGLGVVKGYGDGTFRPNSPITREEFTACVCRFFEAVAEIGENPFNDVDEDGWAYESIMMAAELGWVVGYGDGTFRPKINIKRCEAVTIFNIILVRMTLKEDIPEEYVELWWDLLYSHWAFQDVIEASVDHLFTLNEAGTEIWSMLEDTGEAG